MKKDYGKNITSLLFSIFILTMIFCISQNNTITAQAKDNNLLKYLEFLQYTDPVTRNNFDNWTVTKSEYEEVAALAKEIIGGVSSDYDKAVAIHNWIADNIYYDYDAYYNRVPTTTLTPISVLYSKKTVCSGYAMMLELMYNAVGIPCFYLSGESGNGIPHAWNVAYVGGKWILIDSTWDSGNAYEYGNYIKRSYNMTYFGMEPEEFAESHIQKSDFVGIYQGIVYEVDCVTNELTVVGTIGNSSDITIPSKVIKYPVTAIGRSAFRPNTYIDVSKEMEFNDWLKTVILPDTIRIIKENAFSTCTALKNIVIPKQVSEIQAGAFAYCESLREIVIPEGVKDLSGALFFNCTSLKNIQLPSSLKKISDSALANCKSLANIEIPASVVEIEMGAFMGCSSLTSIKLPENLEKMEGIIFEGTSITTLVIPAKVTNLPKDLFYGAEKLKEVEYLSLNPELLVVDNDIRQIISGSYVERFIIPNGYKEKYRKALSIVVLVEKQVINGDDVMAYDKNLFEQWEWNTSKSFYLPVSEIKTVKESGNTYEVQYALGYTVTTKAKGSTYGEVKVIGYYSLKAVKGGTSSSKQPSKEVTNLIIPEYISYLGNKYYVTEIGDRAFQEFERLKTCTLSQRIKKIGAFAFSGSSLTKVMFPSSLAELGEGAFSYTNIKSVNLPATIKSLGDGALSGMTKLTSITVDKKNTFFKSDGKILYSKNGDTVYTSVVLKGKVILPEGVKTIKKGAFYNSYEAGRANNKSTSTITSIILPKSLATIEAVALYGIAAVEFKGSKPPLIKSPIYATIKVPAGAKAAYQKIKVTEHDIGFLNTIFGYEKNELVFDKYKIS